MPEQGYARSTNQIWTSCHRHFKRNKMRQTGSYLLGCATELLVWWICHLHLQLSWTLFVKQVDELIKKNPNFFFLHRFISKHTLYQLRSVAYTMIYHHALPVAQSSPHISIIASFFSSYFVHPFAVDSVNNDTKDFRNVHPSFSVAGLMHFFHLLLLWTFCQLQLFWKTLSWLNSVLLAAARFNHSFSGGGEREAAHCGMTYSL